MTFFNYDFNFLIGSIEALVNVSMKANNWSAFTNGYETGKNDTYFKGFKLNGKSFPLVVKLTIHAPWKFHETGGKIYNSDQYNDDVKGGVLKFDGKFHFELSVAPELFSKTSFKKIHAEYDEFKDIPVEKWTLDLSDKNFKSFTKKDIASIEKWVMRAGANMRENTKLGIEQQLLRRFNEFYVADPVWAEAYAPKIIKDVFLF